METTKLSTRGQIVLPKSIRDARDWGPGTEFGVEEVSDGVLLRPRPLFARTELSDVAGCLQWDGKRKTLREMEAGIEREVKRRRDSGRY